MIAVRTLAPGQKITESGVYSGISLERYHSGRLCDGVCLSSSGARTIFGKSPMDYWIESPHNPLRIEPKEKEEFIIGRGGHHLLLGEANFSSHFLVRPAEWDSWRKRDARDWRARKMLEGFTCLTPEHIEQIRGMAGLLPWQEGLEDSGLKNCLMVQQGILNGRIEHSIVWRDRETGVWLRSRPDAIPEADTVHADLKTTVSVSEDSIERTIGSLRYDMQAAMARMGMREVCGLELTNFAFIFVMKTPPHAVQVVELDPRDMDEGEKDLRVAIRTFARCMETSRWPGPGGRQSDAMNVSVPPWVRKQADVRRFILEQDLKDKEIAA